VSDVRPFMVRKSERRTTRGPKPKLYYTGTLFDKDETYDFKLWDDAAALLVDPAPGDVLAGPWEFKEFNGGLQAELRVKPTLTSAAEVADFTPYVRVSTLTQEQWRTFYDVSVRPLIEDDSISQLLDKYVLHKTSPFWTAPAAKSHHHNFRAGLQEHVHRLLALYVALDKSIHPLFIRLRKGIVVFGLICHDFMKSREYFEVAPGQYDYSRYGQLVGHLPGGAIWLSKVFADIDRTDDFPKLSGELKLHLYHVLLAHHGHPPEWRSAVVPKTPEAEVVHRLDDFDGKLWGYEESDDGERPHRAHQPVIWFKP
jgi:3'-5' exoribonuclease